jgi:hypothetical protein
MSDSKRKVFAKFSDGKTWYYDDTPYEVAVNGLFMGTYDQWIALGGKRSKKEVEQLFKMAGF